MGDHVTSGIQESRESVNEEVELVLRQGRALDRTGVQLDGCRRFVSDQDPHSGALIDAAR